VTPHPASVAARGFYGEPPRELPWSSFEAERRATVRQGMHQMFVGPTQSGKTVLCRVNVRDRDFVVVWGTKKRDDSLQAYVDEGYVRINRWPREHVRSGKRQVLTTTQLVKASNGRLTEKPYRFERDETGKLRVILWPDFQSLSDLRNYNDDFRKCLEDAYVLGGWSIVIDEMLWATRRTGLGLNERITELAFGAASNKVTLYMCMQRPTGMERTTWSSISDAYVFKCGVIDDIRELAALSTVDPRDAVTAIRTRISRHRFLHLPTRGQSLGWSISEVDPRVI